MCFSLVVLSYELRGLCVLGLVLVLIWSFACLVLVVVVWILVVSDLIVGLALLFGCEVAWDFSVMS